MAPPLMPFLPLLSSNNLLAWADALCAWARYRGMSEEGEAAGGLLPFRMFCADLCCGMTPYPDAGTELSIFLGQRTVTSEERKAWTLEPCIPSSAGFALPSLARQRVSSADSVLLSPAATQTVIKGICGCGDGERLTSCYAAASLPRCAACCALHRTLLPVAATFAITVLHAFCCL